MKTINIKTGSEPLTDKEILEAKEPFSNVLAKFGGFKVPFYKTSWFFGTTGTAFLGIIAGAVFLISNAGHSDPAGLTGINDSSAVNQTFVSPPLDGNGLPYETFVVENSKGGTYRAKSGSVISIPPDAFRTMAGDLPHRTVTIKYREMHNPYEFFLSGVPMQYDTAGASHTFESAGMIEIRAFDPNGELKLAGARKIHIDMITYNDDPKFNLYYLDTIKRNWVYLEKSDVAVADDAPAGNNDDYTFAYQSDNNSGGDAGEITYTLPRTCKIIRNTFKIDFDRKKFPEIGIYENVLFEVNTEKSRFDQKLYDVKWTEIRLKSSKVKGNYLMVLSRPDSSIYIYVYPVFASADYQKAMNVYNKHQKRREQQQADRTTMTPGAMEARDNIRSAGQLAANRTSIDGVRGMDISMMGYYNCDYSLPIQEYTFQAGFICDGQKLEPASIHAVDRAINGIFNFTHGKGEIRCNRKSEIILWVVAPDNRIGIVTPAEFRATTKNTGRPAFRVKLLDTHDGLAKLKEMILA